MHKNIIYCFTIYIFIYKKKKPIGFVSLIPYRLLTQLLRLHFLPNYNLVNLIRKTRIGNLYF